MLNHLPKRKASWPAPNYENPENLHGVLLGLTIPCMTLLVFFLAIRCYSRGVLRQNMKWDDYLMIAAACCSIPVSVISLESLNYGLGLHIWDYKAEWFETYSKMAFASDILFPIACAITKISLCFTYLRLFPSRVDRIFCYTISTFLVLYTLACLLLMLFQCTPIRGFWDKSVVLKCINLRVVLMATAALNSISDVLVYLWPAKPLWSLQLPLKQRLGLICLFSVGVTVCICGGARMYYLEAYFNSDDLYWNAAKVYVVMTLEMNLGIICGCLSGVRPVLAVVFPGYFSSGEAPSGPTYGYSISTGGRRQARPESFPFQSLTDHSDLAKSDDKKDNKAVTLRTDPGKSFAWVDTTDLADDDARTEVPLGSIKVKTVVTRQEEDAHNGLPYGRASNTGSEEWIMEDATGRVKKY